MSFKPQDFSRFLIREFLKRNKFDNTYEQFMKEDTRERVTMTKNELTKLLGIEPLMKRNSKTKSYDTMLDIICDFLVLTLQSSGGVSLPADLTSVNPYPNNNNQTTGHKKVISGVKKQSPMKTQQAWFPSQQPKNQDLVAVQKQEEEDEWGFEESKVTQEQNKGFDSNQQKPAPANLKALNQKPKTAEIKKPQVRMKKDSTKDNDIDDLDDLMGGGGGDDSYGGKKGKAEDQMRDTLGFLKRSEQEKKQKEEQKLYKQKEANEIYKGIQNLTYKLSGFQCERVYEYNLGPSLPASIRNQLPSLVSQEQISMTESNEIRKLLFKSPQGNFLDAWHQGFFFDKSINYGIYQKEGGPCGVLASVQAFFLKHLLFVSQIPLTAVPLDKRDNYIAAAITDILINASENFQNKVTLAISSQNPKQILTPGQCQKLIIKTSDYKQLFYIVKDHIGQFIQPDGQGVVLLVYSVLLTKGIQNIISDMDTQDTSLLTEHGYAAQELINIILVGRACSNVFDGDRDMGDNYIVKGIHRESEIGFLTLYEAYQYFNVGDNFKKPKVPIWIICSESHYSCLFSTDFSLTDTKHQVFDLVYYDELARQEDDIVLTVNVGLYRGPTNLQTTKETIPPIDAVIRTRWDHGQVSWNGRQAIL